MVNDIIIGYLYIFSDYTYLFFVTLYEYFSQHKFLKNEKESLKRKQFFLEIHVIEIKIY